jgi:hypothetical protein
MLEEYPQDYFIKLDQSEFQVGRLTLNQLGNQFSIEIDIVQKESKKIFKHVGILYNFQEKNEAIDAGVQHLSHFLNPLN